VKKGTIIFLNGTSSSGKTTIGKELQTRLNDPFMLVSLDNFLKFYPERFFEPKSQDEGSVLMELFASGISGFHRCIPVLAETGNNLIVDHVLQEDGWLQDCVKRWSGLDVLFVGVKCPLEVLEKREAERGDRKPGTARYQYNRVHSHDRYDLELDTSILSGEECADKIIELLKEEPTALAFKELGKHFAVAQ
jgi:chloramphenicol 3-O phosphotransferase